MRRLLLMVGVAVVAVGGGLTVRAMGGDSAGDTFTGCLGPGGILTRVAIGDEPVGECLGKQVEITWSEGVSPAEFAELAQRVSELESSTQPLGIEVDCDAGDTIGDALARAQEHPAGVFITISGVCEEAISISRDDVTLAAAAPGDGLRAPLASDDVIVVGGDRVSLEGLTVRGGRSGISATSGKFRATGVTIRDASNYGILIGVDAYGFMEGCEVTGSDIGVGVDAGDADIVGCRLGQNFVGASAGLGGTVQIFDSELTENEIGVAASTEGAARIAGATIVGSGTGVSASESATVTIQRATIRDTRGPGIHVRRLAYVDIQEALIEDGGAEGVLVQQSSAIRFRNSTIRGNQGDGISLRDLSIGTGPEGLPGDVQQIIDNGGFGINCAGPSSVGVAQNGFSLSEIVLSGNVAGDTNCP